MIGTLEAGTEASLALLADARAAMAADIVEGAHLALPVVEDDEVLAKNVEEEIVTGLGDAALMPGTDPSIF